MNIKKIIVLLCIFIIIPLIWWLIIIFPDTLEVYKTGMCPAAPTDIPPDPCTVQEFLFRMAFSPFALIAITFLYFVWLIVCVLFYQIYLWIRK